MFGQENNMNWSQKRLKFVWQMNALIGLPIFFVRLEIGIWYGVSVPWNVGKLRLAWPVENSRMNNFLRNSIPNCNFADKFLLFHVVEKFQTAVTVLPLSSLACHVQNPSAKNHWATLTWLAVVVWVSVPRCPLFRSISWLKPTLNPFVLANHWLVQQWAGVPSFFGGA